MTTRLEQAAKAVGFTIIVLAFAVPVRRNSVLPPRADVPRE